MSDYTPTTEEVSVAATQHKRAFFPKQFYRWLAEHDREAKAEALREFAARQDSWCEAGRGGQIISREAMRDALLAEADRLAAEGGADRG